MSCYPGQPCWENYIKINYPPGCDPCSTYIFNSTQVEYLGANLSCTGVNTGDTLETCLQKIDEKMCSGELVAAILATISTDPTLKATLCALIADC